MIGNLLYWIVLGGIVGWVVSLLLGRDFKGGCLTYVAVGIVTMIVLGLLIKIFWVLFVIAVALILAAWLLDYLRLP